MVSFADVAVTDATAHRMLSDYFAERAETFPSAQGAYRTAFPDPGQFVAPNGVFLLAYDEGVEVGCGGIRELRVPLSESEDGTPIVRYEIKHLWVTPKRRGNGYGRAILVELEQRARGFGATESCSTPMPAWRPRARCTARTATTASSRTTTTRTRRTGSGSRWNR